MTDTISSDVRTLVDRAKQGDGEAFGRIYDLYVDQVYAYIQRRVRDRGAAEDLTSDVFLRALRRVHTFEWQGVDFGAWLMTIARNRVNDHFKSARFRLERTVDEVYDQPTPTGTDSPERIAVARDMAKSLGRALESLKDEHREIIELRFVQGLNVAETAEVMGRTVGATKALQYRALKSLTEVIKGEPGLSNLASLSVTALAALLLRVMSP